MHIINRIVVLDTIINIQFIYNDWSKVASLPLESFRGAEEIFLSVTEAEQRVRLMEDLIEANLGVPSVEKYHQKQAELCRVNKNKVIFSF